MTKQCQFNFTKWLLVEEKQQRTIMYHGTSSNNLQSILNNGLMPFPKKRVWQTSDDQSANFETPSKASIGGIYVTTNLLTATSSAYRAGKNDRLLIVMDIHPYSTVADEDDFLQISRIRIPGLMTTPSTLARIYISQILAKNPNYRNGDKFDSSDERYVSQVKAEYVKTILAALKQKVKGKMHPNLEKRIRQLLEDEGFDAALQRQAAHIDPKSFKQYCWDFGDWEEGCPFGPPDKSSSERKWSNFLDQVTRTMKSIVYKNEDDFNKTARLLKPIGFTGKDKIICILEILEPQSGNLKTQIYVHYGNPPQELIKDWEKFKGKWNVINKLTR